MSDDYLIFVPRDPNHAPPQDKQTRAVLSLKARIPRAESVEAEQFAEVRFFDCGENFERVTCPQCSENLELAWWHDALSIDGRGQGFLLSKHELPCCHRYATLNELDYSWAQAFGRFAITAMNPDILELPAQVKEEVDSLLGCETVVVRQHI